jgi:hypothetical protein
MKAGKQYEKLVKWCLEQRKAHKNKPPVKPLARAIREINATQYPSRSELSAPKRNDNLDGQESSHEPPR